MTLAVLRRQEIFRLPALPRDQGICDIFDFTVGKSIFLVVTTLCFDREKPGITRIFRMNSAAPFHLDPEPVLTLSLYHPRNLAIGPESNGARWIWIADHGMDMPPFPGGCSPLYQIQENGRVIVKDDPLLQKLQFSFDGCIWENPQTRELYLFQTNIGETVPRLLRWKNMESRVEDISSLLPESFLNRKERFLVSRIIGSNEEGIDLFLGVDYSCRTMTQFERDQLLRLPFRGKSIRSPQPLPPRLKDKSWSTVEARPFELRQGGSKSMLAIYHDFGFTEGTAEVLGVHDSARLERAKTLLPLPSLKGTRSWISRAAIGDLDGDGRNDIILYLRGTDGPLPESKNNMLILRQNSSSTFDFAPCQAAGYDTHFVGGFFAGDQLIQLRFDGVCEQTWFSF